MISGLLGFLIAIMNIQVIVAQTLYYDWNGFTASTLGCGSDSGALNVGLSQSLPTGASGLKVKQIAFAIYGSNTLPPNIQLDGATYTARLSTSNAQACCGTNCDLAVAVANAGKSWYNSPCGQPSCSNANKWYYMDFSGTSVGTNYQRSIQQATFYDGSGNQIGANMINLGSGSVFFLSFYAQIPTPSITASNTPSISQTNSASASSSISATNSATESVTQSGISTVTK
ncbi:MAG: hypothetical protein EBX50_23440 [Chitinophagia bacterium]|nr:hypothetical protein [Chitinophagia bacterium]